MDISDRSTVTGLALHRRLAHELRRQIQSGQLPAGGAAPSELELAAAWGVSRGTVRQALAALRVEGLLTGGRGSRATVVGPQLRQPFEHLLSFSAWVRSEGHRPGGRLVNWTVARAGEIDADRLGVPVRSRVHRMVRLRLVDGEPVMVERTTFPPEIGELVRGVDLVGGSIYQSLLQRGITFDAAEQEIDAVAAGVVDARLLSVTRRSPLLRVRRRSLSRTGRPLEWSDDRYLPERVSLSIVHSEATPGIARRLEEAR